MFTSALVVDNVIIHIVRVGLQCHAMPGGKGEGMRVNSGSKILFVANSLPHIQLVLFAKRHKNLCLG